MQIPDHPQVANALITGYPEPRRCVRCADCGQEYSGIHRIYIDGGDTLCGNCLMARLMDNLTTDEFADALGIRKTSAGDYLEEQGADFYDGS